MKISSQEPEVENTNMLKSWKGKLVLVEIQGQKELRFGVLEGFDIEGMLLGPKKGLTNNMGFYEWKDIARVNYAKENDEN